MPTWNDTSPFVSVFSEMVVPSWARFPALAPTTEGTVSAPVVKNPWSTLRETSWFTSASRALSASPCTPGTFGSVSTESSGAVSVTVAACALPGVELLRPDSTRVLPSGRASAAEAGCGAPTAVASAVSASAAAAETARLGLEGREERRSDMVSFWW